MIEVKVSKFSWRLLEIMHAHLYTVRIIPGASNPLKKCFKRTEIGLDVFIYV
jgi:hypothetical protein